jgi:hypothetical protein
VTKHSPPNKDKSRALVAPTMLRAANVRPDSYREEDNSIEICWTTGAAGLRFDWYDGEYYVEELSLEPGAVNLDRLNAGACLLDSHDDYSLAAVLGSVVPGTARIEGGEGLARVRLATTPDVADTNQKIIDGHIRFVSVGYNVHEYLRTEKEGEKPHLLAVDWEPMELSMVAVPFDPGAQVRARTKTRQEGHSCIIRGAAAIPPKESEMGDLSPTPAPTLEPSPPVIDTVTDPVVVVTPPAAAPEVERAAPITIKRIRERAGALGDTVVLDLIERHIDAPMTEPDLNAALVEHYTRTRQVPPIDGTITITGDEKDKYRAALTGALIVRMTDSPAAPKDGGEVFGHMTTREIARDYLARNGFKNHAAMGPFELFNAALGLQRHGAQTSSDFAIALQQAGNLAILDAYEQVEEGNWRMLSRESNYNDFRPHAEAGLTGTPEFLVVEENGEYTYSSFQDLGATSKLWTAGRIISLSRQLLINDQLGLFGDMTRHLGRGAALHEANSWWANVLGNPTLADGVALFHASHGNLAGSGVAPTVASLGAGRAAMRKMKDRDGATPLYITPKTLVIGPDLETAVDQLLTSITPALVGNTVPQFVRSLTVEVEPRITDYSWYLFADPAKVASLKHGYLNGQRGIYTDTRVGFEVDGVEYKGRLDFNARAVDYRGVYKNPGAAPS